MLFWRILHGATCLVGCLEFLASALEFLDAIQVLFSLTDSVASSLLPLPLLEHAKNDFGK